MAQRIATLEDLPLTHSTSRGAVLEIAPALHVAKATRHQPLQSSTPKNWRDIESSFALPPDFLETANSGLSLTFRLTGPANTPVVLVLGGISANRHVADGTPHTLSETELSNLTVLPTETDTGEVLPVQGWWRDLAGAGRTLDTQRFQILSFDFLPGDFLPGDFEADNGGGQCETQVSTSDQARAAQLLLKRLGISQLHAFIGSSYGGMVALQFAALFPESTQQVVVACAAHRPHPMGTAWRSIQRKIVRFGLETGENDRAMSLARELGMTTYRTAEEFGVRFPKKQNAELNTKNECVESYLATRGQAFIGKMSPARYLALSHSIDTHWVNPAAITVPLTLVACKQDQLVPPEEVEALGKGVSGPVHRIEFDSLYGHDAFLKEPGWITQALEPLLRELPKK